MRLFLVAAALSLAAVAARADGPVATTSTAEQSPPQPQAAAPPLATARDAAPNRVAMGPCGPERVKPDGKLTTTPHGEIDAGIGTHGYRHLGGTVCQPIGQNGSVEVSAGVSQAQWGRR